jgi:hypothetical protein
LPLKLPKLGDENDRTSDAEGEFRNVETLMMPRDTRKVRLMSLLYVNTAKRPISSQLTHDRASTWKPGLERPKTKMEAPAARARRSENFMLARLLLLNA